MFKSTRSTGEKGIRMDAVIPRTCVQSETEQDGTVTLLKPKFSNTFLVKYLVPRMKRPFFRIHLDEIGSAVWRKLDGQKNALDISHELEAELGEKIAPVYERFGIFLRTLKQQKLIEF